VLTYQAEHNNQLFCLHYEAAQCNELIIYHSTLLATDHNQLLKFFLIPTFLGSGRIQHP